MGLPKKSETQVYPISIGRCLANTQSLKASNGIGGTTVAICSQSPEIENEPSKAHVPTEQTIHPKISITDRGLKGDGRVCSQRLATQGKKKTHGD